MFFDSNNTTFEDIREQGRKNSFKKSKNFVSIQGSESSIKQDIKRARQKAAQSVAFKNSGTFKKSVLQGFTAI
jgi:hypothetical protein